MPILLDLSQNIISNAMMTQDIKKGIVDKMLLKHMVLNSILNVKKKFGSKYGPIIICCDSPQSWRKEEFRYYKGNRKNSREKSVVDWKEVFSVVDELKVALRENFPYKILEVSGAEADDVIAILCKDIIPPTENIMIVATDKDYYQLHSLPNVSQYCPKNKKEITVPNPKEHLKELIIRGDKGDGVPNIKSDGDVFMVAGKRQPSIFEKDVVVWLGQDYKTFCVTESMQENFVRNQKLIDFNFIPEHIVNNIKVAFEQDIKGNRTKITEYFMNNRMKNLLEYINDF